MRRELDYHEVSKSAHEYHYHQLLDLLLKSRGQSDVRDKPPWLMLKPSDWLSFPASDVRKLHRLSGSHWQLEASFFGLYGVDAPTPHYILQDVTQATDAGRCIAAFLDVFNQNAYWLLHKTWQKFQPLARTGNENLFTRLCFALSGHLSLNNDGYIDSDHDGGAIKQKEGAFAVGALSHRKQSLCVVQNILRTALSNERLTVSSNRVKTVDTKQSFSLGERISLGENTLLGSRVSVAGYSVSVNLGLISFDDLAMLKPSGEGASSITKLLEHYLPERTSYQITAHVNAKGMASVKLGPERHGITLGMPIVLGESQEHIEYEFTDESYKRAHA